jgi:hypothetical protein
MKIRCRMCPNEFEPNHDQHLYCSPECWTLGNPAGGGGFFGEQVTGKPPGICVVGNCRMPARYGLRTCKRHEGGLMR